MNSNPSGIPFKILWKSIHNRLGIHLKSMGKPFKLHGLPIQIISKPFGNPFKVNTESIQTPRGFHSTSMGKPLHIISKLLGFLYPATAGMLPRPLDSLSSFRGVASTFG